CDDGADVPRLLRDHPGVGVQVTSRTPGRIPVLPGHVPDQERGDGRQAELGVQVQEVAEPSELVLVEPVRRGHEVGPVQERPGHRQPVLAQDSELLANDRGVIPAPHQRTAGTRPEVGAEPAERRAAMADLGEVAVHLGCFPLYFTEPEVRPATRYFCSNRNATTTGTLTTREAAMIWFQYTLIWVEKFCSPME